MDCQPMTSSPRLRLVVRSPRGTYVVGKDEEQFADRILFVLELSASRFHEANLLRHLRQSGTATIGNNAELIV